jgi:hypothetical protein
MYILCFEKEKAQGLFHFGVRDSDRDCSDRSIFAQVATMPF